MLNLVFSSKRDSETKEFLTPKKPTPSRDFDFRIDLLAEPDSPPLESLQKRPTTGKYATIFRKYDDLKVPYRLRGVK